MTITKTAIIPPKMAAVLPLPAGSSVSPCEEVPHVGVSDDKAGGCVTTAPVKKNELIGHCYYIMSRLTLTFVI